MFSYIAGRLVADQYGLAFSCGKVGDFFPGGKTEGIDNSNKPPIKVRERDIPNIEFNNKGHYRFRKGVYQNYRRDYSGKSNRIRELLHEEKKPMGDTLLCIRRGAFAKGGFALPRAYFDFILRNFDLGDIFVTTDQPDHFVESILKDYNLNLLPGEFNTLSLFKCQFDNIVMSHSTYHWWLAFLSPNSKVFFPMPTFRSGKGCYASNRIENGIDLRVDEERYTYIYHIDIEDNNGYDYRGHLAFHKRSRVLEM